MEPGVTPYGRIEQRKVLGASMAQDTLRVDGLGQHGTHVEWDGPVENPCFTRPGLVLWRVGSMVGSDRNGR